MRLIHPLRFRTEVSTRAAREAGAPDETLFSVAPVFTVLVIAMVFLQKLGSDAGVGINLIILWIAVGLLIAHNRAEFVLSRLVLMVLVLDAMMLSIIVGTEAPKLTAVYILTAMYAGFTLRVWVTRDEASHCFKVFQSCMVIIAAIVLCQQAIQYTIGSQFWPNLDVIVPKSFLYPGFAYIRPYSWQSPYLEPNGIFFLEPSVLSLYLAIAIGLEIEWFRNMWRLGLYATAMLACLAETGPVALILAGPFLLAKFGRKLAIIVVILGIPASLVLFEAGWLDIFLDRTTELSNSNSSGYNRVVLPLQSIIDQFSNSEEPILTGFGPGSSTKGLNIVQWPFSKLFYEYGFLTAFLFHLYLLSCVFDRPPSYPLTLIMLLPLLFFGGGFVSHASVMPLILFGSLLRVGSGRVMASNSINIPHQPHLLSPLTNGGPKVAHTVDLQATNGHGDR
jgi:hypothetical protein